MLNAPAKFQVSTYHGSGVTEANGVNFGQKRACFLITRPVTHPPSKNSSVRPTEWIDLKFFRGVLVPLDLLKNNFGAVWRISLGVHGSLNFRKNKKSARIRSVRSARVRSVRVRMRGTK